MLEFKPCEAGMDCRMINETLWKGEEITRLTEKNWRTAGIDLMDFYVTLCPYYTI